MWDFDDGSYAAELERYEADHHYNGPGYEYDPDARDCERYHREKDDALTER